MLFFTCRNIMTSDITALLNKCHIYVALMGLEFDRQCKYMIILVSISKSNFGPNI